MDETLTVDEAAEGLGTSPRFPRRLITERPIAFVRAKARAHSGAALDACVRQYGAADDEDVMSRGRPFGSIRRLPSRRYQVRYLGPDGLRRSAPRTFPTRADARRWLSLVEGEIARGEWVDTKSDGEQLASYAKRWIAERPGLSERSIEL